MKFLQGSVLVPIVTVVPIFGTNSSTQVLAWLPPQTGKCWTERYGRPCPAAASGKVFFWVSDELFVIHHFKGEEPRSDTMFQGLKQI